MDESDLAINPPLLPILEAPKAETPTLLDAATAGHGLCGLHRRPTGFVGLAT